MSEVKRKCRYESPFTGWECPYEALEDSKEGFCIFHERRKDKDIKKFNEGIKKILEDKDSDAYHFEGFFFPDSISFEGFEFNKSAFFINAVFTGELNHFEQTEFKGKDTSFNGTEFLGKKTDFTSAKFSGDSCAFLETKFRSHFTSFILTKFSAQYTGFYKCEFSSETTRFAVAQFSGDETQFYKMECKGRLEFALVSFLKKVMFTDVDLRKCAFIDVDLKNVDFSLLHWDWSHRLLNELDVNWMTKTQGMKKADLFLKTSEIYRQLKVQFHNKRDFAKAGMFHFREQECKRMACKLPKDFFKWIFLWILRLSCGYGEKLRNVGLSTVALVLIFGIFYMFLGLHAADQAESLIFQYKIGLKSTAPFWTIIKDYFTSVSFSLKGFFPLWRFQQYKLVGDFANLVAGIEFLLGAFFVGLFIYVFRRRMEK